MRSATRRRTPKNSNKQNSKKGGIEVARPKSPETIKKQQQKSISKGQAVIRESLENQLRALEASVPHFRDMIDTYITLWAIKKRLEFDIAEKGIRYDEYMSTGKKKSVINPAIKELENTTKQMLSILKEMNLTTSESTGGESEDEEL